MKLIKSNQEKEYTMESYTETITPKMAAEMLTHNTRNRPMRKGTVEHYAAMMGKGAWELNGEAIKFDVEGALLDGQHRLAAIIKAGKPIAALVIRGLPNRVFDTLDTGVKRNVGDVLALEGYKYARNAAATAVILMNYRDSGKFKASDGRRGLTVGETVDFVNNNEEIIDSAAFIVSHQAPLKRLAGYGAPMIALHFLLKKADAYKCEKFFHGLVSGADLSIDSPVLSLRNRIFSSELRDLRARDEYYALFIKAWNAFCKGRNIHVLRFASKEDFPKIEGLPKDWYSGQ